MTCKVLRLSVNTLTADDKYSLLSRENLMQSIHMHLSEKQKKIYELLCAIIKSTLNFEIFQTNMTLIAYVFAKLRTAKNVVR